MRKNRKIFFDMDGVLAYFRRVPLEEALSRGYMLGCEPICNIVAAANILSANGFTLCIASAYGYEYAKEEKNSWLDSIAPIFEKPNRHFFKFGSNKGKELSGIIEPGDVFIDDYNPNLHNMAAEQPGVICIKCVNDINDGRDAKEEKTWSGARIDITSDPEVIADTIMGLIYVTETKSKAA